MSETDRTLKLIWGDTEEEQIRAAEEAFQRPVSELKQIATPQSSNSGKAALFCPAEDWTKFGNMDAVFQLDYQPDGIYLELLPKQGYGTEIDRDAMEEFLRRKNLSGMAKETVKKVVEDGWGREKIAPPQEQRALNEELAVTVSADEMDAYVVLMPPEEGGTLLTAQEVDAALRSAGVVSGIDEKMLVSLLQNRNYGKPVCVAQGKLPQDGENGKLIFHFNRQHGGTPWLDQETGKADFKRLDWIERVQEGDLLVSRTPATAGTPGYSVLGKT